MEVFQEALGSNSVATGLIVLLLVLFIFCTVAVLAATSRVTWAFARDGLPGSSWIKKVSRCFHPVVLQPNLITPHRWSREHICLCTPSACPRLSPCPSASSTLGPPFHCT